VGGAGPVGGGGGGRRWQQESIEAFANQK
jgi:hypothetical protein